MQAYIDAELAVMRAQAAAVRISNRKDVVESDAASVQYAEAGVQEVTEQQVADVKAEVLKKLVGADCAGVVANVFAQLEGEKRQEHDQDYVATSGPNTLTNKRNGHTNPDAKQSNGHPTKPVAVSIHAVHAAVVNAPVATELATCLSTLFHAEGDSPPSDAAAREALEKAEEDEETTGVPHIIGEFIVCSILKQCVELASKSQGPRPRDRALIVKSVKERVANGCIAMSKMEDDGDIMAVVNPLFARLMQGPHWAEECVKRFAPAPPDAPPEPELAPVDNRPSEKKRPEAFTLLGLFGLGTTVAVSGASQ